MRKGVIASLSVALAACGHESGPVALSATDVAFQQQLQQQLLDAKPGSVIEIPAGRHVLDRVLTLRANAVTVRGAGADKTVLAFDGEVSGPEGMLVYANDFTIEHLALEDSKGDGIKINTGKNITVRDVRVGWSGKPKKTNGAYGIYPVQCANVLIEDSMVSGASDAGIYVGQSQNVIVRRNRVEANVAGIEIENTIGADVFDNLATGNTGGILVFNLPNLAQPGHSTRVFHNQVYRNNLGNFAAKGAAVASVPAGSGIVVNANSLVEIFDNDIADNGTANVIISANYLTNYANKPGIDPKYDPYPRAINIYGNRFSGGGDAPDGLRLQTLKMSLFGLNGHLPDIFWDGYRDERRLVNGELPPNERLCVRNANARVLDADGPHGYEHPKVMDAAALQCELPKLPAVVIPGKA